MSPVMIAWLGKVVRSFGFAIAGVAWLLRTERNAQIHAVVALAVIALGAWLHVSRIEWCIIGLAVGLVIAAEALNSAIEHLADRVTLENDEQIRRVKDVAAGAVLIASLAAGAVGLLVFVPHLLAKA